MARSGPPAYAWDWFARQRLLWRETRSRLAASSMPPAVRYGAVETRSEVVPLLRSDYSRDDTVRLAVDAVVAEMAFLGRTDRTFADLGITNAPRGMRWWWTSLTGEELDRPRDAPSASPDRPELSSQLSLDDVLGDVLGGYGDRADTS